MAAFSGSRVALRTLVKLRTCAGGLAVRDARHAPAQDGRQQ